MTTTSKRAAQGVRRSYKMRAYPTSGQVAIFERLCGAKCEAWNWAFNARQECYAHQQRLLGRFELSRLLTVHRPTSAGLAHAPGMKTLAVIAGNDGSMSHAVVPKLEARGK